MIRRIYPPPAGAIAGHSFLALRQLVPFASPGARLQMNATRIYALALDPEYTAPGTAIAVQAEGASSPLVLRPGDEPLRIPGGARYVQHWNANGAVAERFHPDARPRGAVAFLAAERPEAVIPWRRGVRPRAPVSLLNIGGNGLGGVEPAPSDPGPWDFRFSCIPGGLERVRWQFAPIAAGGPPFVFMAPPAAFAATVKVYALMFNSNLTSSQQGGVDTVSPSGLWSRVGGDFALSAAQLAVELAPPPGALALAAFVSAIAGAGVDVANIACEVYGS